MRVGARIQRRAAEHGHGIYRRGVYRARVACELRAATLIGPDSSAHTQQFLELTERRATHGAIMLGCLVHVSCSSCSLALTFLHDATAVLRAIAETEAASASASPSASSPPSSSVNEMTCVAAACLQVLRVVGDKLHDMVPVQLNSWVNGLQQHIEHEAANSGSGTSANKGRPKFATIRMEVILSLAKQYVGGARRPRAEEPEKRSANVMLAPDADVLAKAVDVLAAVARPGATPLDRRTWKRSFTTISVPDMAWAVASQPHLQGSARWWDAGGGAGQALSEDAANILFAPEKKATRAVVAVAAVERRDLYGDGGDDDDAPSQEQPRDGDDGPTAEQAAAQKRRDIKQLRAFESAACGQRFVSERQRGILQILDSAFDDGEACQRLTKPFQQNEGGDVAAVLLQCCMQEATYNSFYAKIACRLLSVPQRKMWSRVKKAFQFAIWDAFGAFRIHSGALPDIAAQINLACFVAQLIADKKFDLSVLRGLDIDVGIPANVGMFLRVFLLRLLLVLDFPTQIVAVLFGHQNASGRKADEAGSDVEEDGDGNVQSVVGANSVIKDKVRAALLKFVDQQFVNEATAASWMVPLLDVVAGTSLDADELAAVVEQLPKRIKAARRAIADGGES